MAIILNIDELKALCDEIEYEKRNETQGQDFFYDLLVFQVETFKLFIFKF